jgi:hypothetical protein
MIVLPTNCDSLRHQINLNWEAESSEETFHGNLDVELDEMFQMSRFGSTIRT